MQDPRPTQDHQVIWGTPSLRSGNLDSNANGFLPVLWGWGPLLWALKCISFYEVQEVSRSKGVHFPQFLGRRPCLPDSHWPSILWILFLSCNLWDQNSSNLKWQIILDRRSSHFSLSTTFLSKRWNRKDGTSGWLPLQRVFKPLLLLSLLIFSLLSSTPHLSSTSRAQ